MPNTTRSIYGDGPALVRQAFYTAREINSSNASDGDTRGYANFDLQIGDIVQLDPYNFEHLDAAGNKQIGICVGIPTAEASGIGKTKFYVVTALGPNVNAGVDPTRAVNALNTAGDGTAAPVNPRAGGWVDVCPFGIVSAVADGSGTAIVIGELLKVAIGAVAADGTVTRAELVSGEADTALDTPAELRPYCATALQATTGASSNTSVTKIKVAFGGGFQFGF